MKYYPILKSKRGEFVALKELSALTKDAITPIIEVLTGSSDMTITQLSSGWAHPENEVILDASLFIRDEDDIDEYVDMLDALKEKGVNGIPSVEVDSADEFIDAISPFVNEHSSQICLRLRGRYLRPRMINSYIETTIQKFDLDAGQLIILLDFDYVTSSNIDYTKDRAIECIEEIEELNSYHSVIIASGSFPENLAGISPDTRKLLTRYEWQLWNSIAPNDNIKNLSYGDYSVKYPIHDPTVSRFEPTCSIKYTTEHDYLIYRGIRGSEHRLGGGQYHEKCRLLIADPLYDGETFSWGDNEIIECSGRSANPGNAESWVRIGHNHHITKIVSLL